MGGDVEQLPGARSRLRLSLFSFGLALELRSTKVYYRANGPWTPRGSSGPSLQISGPLHRCTPLQSCNSQPPLHQPAHRHNTLTLAHTPPSLSFSSLSPHSLLPFPFPPINYPPVPHHRLHSFFTVPSALPLFFLCPHSHFSSRSPASTLDLVACPPRSANTVQRASLLLRL